MRQTCLSQIASTYPNVHSIHKAIKILGKVSELLWRGMNSEGGVKCMPGVSDAEERD